MKNMLRLLLGICAAFAACGCASTRSALELDARHPSIRQTARGTMIGDRLVRPEDVPDCLAGHDVPHERTIHILLDDDVRDLRPARFLMACLAKAGYTRPVLVTKRHSEAKVVDRRKEPKKAPTARQTTSPSRKIRYKRKQQ